MCLWVDEFQSYGWIKMAFNNIWRVADNEVNNLSTLSKISHSIFNQPSSTSKSTAEYTASAFKKVASFVPIPGVSAAFSAGVDFAKKKLLEKFTSGRFKGAVEKGEDYEIAKWGNKYFSMEQMDNFRKKMDAAIANYQGAAQVRDAFFQRAKMSGVLCNGYVDMAKHLVYAERRAHKLIELASVMELIAQKNREYAESELKRIHATMKTLDTTMPRELAQSSAGDHMHCRIKGSEFCVMEAATGGISFLSDSQKAAGLKRACKNPFIK